MTDPSGDPEAPSDDTAADMPASPLPTAITRLVLTNLRGYGLLDWQGDGRSVVLTGPNGAGKTNLLEGISLLSPGRGLRGAALAEMLRRDAEAGAGWGVAADLATPDGPVRLGTGVQATGDGTRRVARINGHPVGKSEGGLAAFGRLLPMVWLTPQMDRLFLDAAGARRRWLDRLVYAFDTDHARRLSGYEQLVRDRGRILKDAVTRGVRADPAWLSTLEARIAAEAVAIAAARVDTVARLRRAVAAAEVPDDPFPSADIALDGTVEAAIVGGTPALAVEEDLTAGLAAARAVDGKIGGASVGPHRSDLKVRHRGKDLPAADCSTGEQKALLAGLTLAQARLIAADRGTPPVLLLDEVAAHFDPVRRAALQARIAALGAQAWMTGTEPALFADWRGKAEFFTVENATVTRDSPDRA